MSMLRNILLLAVVVSIGSATTQAGICKLGSSCGDCCEKSSCPSDYCCVGECKTEEIKRHCYETKCEPVVVPPVKLPCCKCKLKKMFGRGGCCEGCCSSCESSCCNDGLLHKLCSKFTKCRVRCVKTFSKKEYECGTKCVCEWKAVCKGGCGNSDCFDSGSCTLGATCEPQCCAPSGCQ